MNGLKYIRTKCNYSQRALAEAMGVSRQAINMWENSKKLPSKERKEDLCKKKFKWRARARYNTILFRSICIHRTKRKFLSKRCR